MKEDLNSIVDYQQIILQVRQAISSSIDEAIALSHEHFFKSNKIAKGYGLTMTEVNKIAKNALVQIKAYPKQTIFELCEKLWESGYLEEALIACKWSEAQHKKYEPADFFFFERWLSNHVSNWAECDTLCTHTIGWFVMMYPDFISELKKWAKSSNRWVRRGAAVSLIVPARKGLFLNDILEIADTLLLDKDDMIQKGYGWMLKAASLSETFVKGSAEIKKMHLEAIFNFVMKNRATMPRTALRYAIEKMPAEMKEEAMKKN